MELTKKEYQLLKELFKLDSWCLVPEDSNKIEEIEGLKNKFLIMTGVNCIRITYLGKKTILEF